MNSRYSDQLNTQCNLTDLYRSQLKLTTSELKKARNTIQNLKALLISFTSDFQIKTPDFQPYLDLLCESHLDDSQLQAIEEDFKRNLSTLSQSSSGKVSIFTLPNDLIYLISEFLPARELTVFSQTCKEIFSMCQSAKLWRSLARCRWGDSDYDRLKFVRRYSQEMMWFHARPAVSTLIGHSGSVTCLCLTRQGGSFVSCSDDCSLALWEVRSSQQDSAMIKQHHQQTKSINKKVNFYGHGGPVWTCCESGNNTLISGSHDKTLKIWNMNTGQCQFTMRGHNNWISAIDCNSTVIVSAAWDSTVKCWDLETHHLTQSLQFNDIVFALNLSQEHLALGMKSHSLELWDLPRTAQVLSFLGHLKAVNAVKMQEQVIVSASSDKLVKVWDCRSGECVGSLNGHKNKVFCIDFDSRLMKIVSGGYDKSVLVWDMRNFSNPRSVLKGHSEPVFCVKMDESKLVSGSMDQSIKIWNFMSGLV